MSRHRHRRTRSGAWRWGAVVAGMAALVMVISMATVQQVDAPTDSPNQERGRRTATALEPEAAPPSATSPAVPTPAGQRVPDTGPGTFEGAAGSSPRTGSAGTLLTYRVEVEKNLPLSASAFAASVDATLGDERGWTKRGAHSFRRDEDASIRIVLATPTTTDRLCAPLRTRGDVSCRNGNVVAINAVRWFRGADTYGDDVDGYRDYVINHEVGHSLGFSHVRCPARGAKAPVMLQQTLRLEGCESNPWP